MEPGSSGAARVGVSSRDFTAHRCGGFLESERLAPRSAPAASRLRPQDCESCGSDLSRDRSKEFDSKTCNGMRIHLLKRLGKGNSNNQGERSRRAMDGHSLQLPGATDPNSPAPFSSWCCVASSLLLMLFHDTCANPTACVFLRSFFTGARVTSPPELFGSYATRMASGSCRMRSDVVDSLPQVSRILAGSSAKYSAAGSSFSGSIRWVRARVKALRS